MRLDPHSGAGAGPWSPPRPRDELAERRSRPAATIEVELGIAPRSIDAAAHALVRLVAAHAGRVLLPALARNTAQLLAAAPGGVTARFLGREVASARIAGFPGGGRATLDDVIASTTRAPDARFAALRASDELPAGAPVNPNFASQSSAAAGAGGAGAAAGAGGAGVGPLRTTPPQAPARSANAIVGGSVNVDLWAERVALEQFLAPPRAIRAAAAAATQVEDPRAAGRRRLVELAADGGASYAGDAPGGESDARYGALAGLGLLSARAADDALPLPAWVVTDAELLVHYVATLADVAAARASGRRSAVAAPPAFSADFVEWGDGAMPAPVAAPAAGGSGGGGSTLSPAGRVALLSTAAAARRARGAYSSGSSAHALTATARLIARRGADVPVLVEVRDSDGHGALLPYAVEGGTYAHARAVALLLRALELRPVAGLRIDELLVALDDGT